MLESVIAMLLHCSADQEKGSASTRDTTKVVAVDREGKRVRELCVTALQVRATTVLILPYTVYHYVCILIIIYVCIIELCV